jgi:hypothetical protein
MKKILVIGCGMDVTSRKRGNFINETFDQVVFIKYSINHYESFKEYTGDPTIWVRSEYEFYKYSEVENIDPLLIADWDLWWNEKNQIAAQQRIYTNISKTRITEIWNDNNPKNTEKFRYNFIPPKNIHGKQVSIVNKNYKPGCDTTGLSVIFEAIDLGYEVYYLGFDSHLKGYHYFHHVEDTRIPYKERELPSPSMEQYLIIKQLEKNGLITHVDKIIDCKL